MKQRIHFIAIGGALMHNLALALQQQGHQVSGSDDEIYEPSRSRLDKAGLLPPVMGWHPERITVDIDAIILGMHARIDNPELLRAKELGLTIYSYPEYLYQQSKDKLRIVVGGSHGKTTTTSMIMHILRENKIDFDYAVGAQLEGFNLMVRLSDAPVIVIEGDEYLSSPIDPQPKFLHYKPNIAIITGVAWDHINVFPTFKKYRKQFKKFIQSIDTNGSLFYFGEDNILCKYADETPAQKTAYSTPPFEIKKNQTYICYTDASKKNIRKKTALSIFGKHNLQNLQAARLVCRELGLSDTAILKAMTSFAGAAKRLEKLAENKKQVIYKDFAHAPSKVKATVNAVKNQYPKRKLTAVLELHTFSSLNKEFLIHYAATMAAAEKAIVYYNKHTLQMKKMPDIAPEEVQDAFLHADLEVYTDSDLLQQRLKDIIKTNDKNLLLMSSGNWGGIDLKKLAQGK